MSGAPDSDSTGALTTAHGLYAIVETYASFGNHHTGTDADRATTAWLSELLTGLGAQVEHDPYRFDRFIGEASLAISDADVPCLPLFYSALGEVDTATFEITRVEHGAVGNAHKFDGLLPVTTDQTPLVIAIDGPDDLAVQANRVPSRLLGRPAVVIPGNWHDRVQQGAHLRFSAHSEPGESANVVATLGDPNAPEIMITTPLTGWTPAAGERGTGLAAALALAVNLAADHRVIFSACSGHEIDHLGLRHYLAARDLTGARAIHLGASIAATEPVAGGEPVLGDRRMTLTTATGATRSAIAELVPTGNWTMPDLDPPWPGEGGTWLEAGAQVLSFLGAASLFHTTDDLPGKATTPQALHTASTVVTEATRIFLKGTQ